jgi:heterodisulfide reductase subunit C
LTQINIKLRQKLVKKIPELLKCFQCGSCVSSCPAEKYGKSYSPRRKILAALYGDDKLFTKELWRCLTCNTCNERCPQDVNPYNIIIKLKNYTVENNAELVDIKKSADQVKKTGRSLVMTERMKDARKNFDLPELKENAVNSKI